MKVTLLASTEIDVKVFPGGTYGDRFGNVTDQWMETDDEALDADTLAEFAGRSCYQSFHKPNPKTAANEDYLANILAQGHFSVLEHASATFYVTGVSRALTHELIRHRHLSYSELSQRFVNVEDAEMVTPPAFSEVDGTQDTDVPVGDGCIRNYEFGELLDATKDFTSEVYAEIVKTLTEKGLTRKQAREAARSVMPNAVETRIVVTGNHRAWRDFLNKRYSVHADAEIRELAAEIMRQLKEIAPATFQDYPEVPFE